MSEKPESPRVQELEAEARLLAQQGKYGESLMLWVRIWEEKAMAWEAAGKPEYAAAERAQAERCRQRLASLDEPPSESSRVNTWGDVVSQLKELGRVRSFSDRQSLDALEQICRERGMVGLSLKALSNIFAECWQATQKTIGDDTPLSEIVAILREASAPAPNKRVTLDDVVAIVRKPKRQTIKNHLTAARKDGRLVPESLKTGGTSEDTYLYVQLRAWLIVEFPRYKLDALLPRDAAGLPAAKVSARGTSRT